MEEGHKSSAKEEVGKEEGLSRGDKELRARDPLLLHRNRGPRLSNASPTPIEPFFLCLVLAYRKTNDNP